MKFISILALVAPALATPITSVEAPALEKRIAANTCTYKSVESGAQFEYTISMAGWGNDDDTSKDGCGGGLLDNLRGQCGDILNWGCDAVTENPHDTRVHFSLSGWVATAPGCVQDAIYLASPADNKATGVTCTQ